MHKILIIDDDVNIIRSLKLVLSSYDIVSTTNPLELTNYLDTTIDVVILDVYLSGINGKDILLTIQKEMPQVPVIMISGLASFDEALECVRLGAFDFIEKPLHPNRLFVSLENAIKMKQFKKQVVQEILPIHHSQKMRALVHLVEKIAPLDSPVLISGESGSGKDLFARLIHSLSSYSEKDMMKINCGAIPEDLVESELFGHKRGSFTGADRDYPGKIQSAQGSTLFLDEVGELPLKAQVKLLRFLENGEIQRVGEERNLFVKARIVCATNRNLMEMVEEGRFREDLYYRLNVIEIHIPSLNERKDEIPLLAKYFASKCSIDNDVPAVTFSDEALEFFQNIELKGNIRELRNIVQRTVLLNSQHSIIEAEHILLNRTPANVEENLFEQTMSLVEAKNLLERRYILSQLKKYDYSIKDTAEALDLLPTNLCRKMKTLNIENQRKV